MSFNKTEIITNEDIKIQFATSVSPDKGMIIMSDSDNEIMSWLTVDELKQVKDELSALIDRIEWA